jgi:hypothetical protein
MKRPSTRAARRRADQLLPVHARMARESLPEEFTRRTMASVRCAKARQHQSESLTVRSSGFFLAAVALACLVVIASVVALMSGQATSTEPAIVRHAPPVSGEYRELRGPVMLARGSFEISDPFVAPIRSEVEALFDTGRDLGETMLSALPAQPRAWTQHLTEQAGR